MKQDKLIIFTNIPAPYRVTMFNDLVKVFQQEGRPLDFKVLFMGRTEPNRSWEVNTEKFFFPFSIGRGLLFSTKRYYFYLNFFLLLECIKPNKHLLLGASWNNVNVLILVLLKRLGLLSNTISIWSEANYMTCGSQRTGRLKALFRRWVLNSVDGFFVLPGRIAVFTLERWGVKSGRVLILPNLVDDKLFGGSKPKCVPAKGLLRVLLVARLDERSKGILNFMSAIGRGILSNVELRIVGEGGSRGLYRDYILENGLEENVFLLGSRSPEDVAYEYDRADIFVLPSLSDPSPLAVVEALKKGLPLFISNRCGNHFEAVSEGDNGFIFDPMNHAEVKEKFLLMLEDRNRLASFSKKSCELADRNFNTESILRKVFSDLSSH